ncbi:hypothetical protein HN51_020001 [Arachis hypogaea]
MEKICALMILSLAAPREGYLPAQLTSAAYQLLGIADLGFIPKIFGDRLKKFNTLWMGILVSTIIFGDVVGICIVSLASEKISIIEEAL